MTFYLNSWKEKFFKPCSVLCILFNIISLAINLTKTLCAWLYKTKLCAFSKLCQYFIHAQTIIIAIKFSYFQINLYSSSFYCTDVSIIRTYNMTVYTKSYFIAFGGFRVIKLHDVGLGYNIILLSDESAANTCYNIKYWPTSAISKRYTYAYRRKQETTTKNKPSASHSRAVSRI